MKLLQDGHELLKELLKTFNFDKIYSEWSQNYQNLNATSPNLLELVSYTHKIGKTAIRWTHTPERIPWHIQN